MHELPVSFSFWWQSLDLRFHYSMARLQHKAEWLNINFEKKDLNSPQNSHLPPDEFGEICFFFAFNFKRNVTDFFSSLYYFNTKLCFVLLSYYCRALQVSPHRINSGLSGKGCSSVHLASPLSPPWYLTPPNSHIQK